MTEEQIALARRAVACRAWRWMPGMRALSKNRRGVAAIRVCDDIREWIAWEYEFPDLTDPATLGCLLALVREAWGDPMAAATRGKYAPDMVYVDLYHVNKNGPCRGVAGFGSTEAEALVAALEAAP